MESQPCTSQDILPKAHVYLDVADPFIFDHDLTTAREEQGLVAEFISNQDSDIEDNEKPIPQENRVAISVHWEKQPQEYESDERSDGHDEEEKDGNAKEEDATKWSTELGSGK